MRPHLNWVRGAARLGVGERLCYQRLVEGVLNAVQQTGIASGFVELPGVVLEMGAIQQGR